MTTMPKDQRDAVLFAAGVMRALEGEALHPPDLIEAIRRMLMTDDYKRSRALFFQWAGRELAKLAGVPY